MGNVRKKTSEDEQVDKTLALIKRATAGDEVAMAELRPLAKEKPRLYDRYSDLAGNVHRSILKSMSGQNLVFQEATKQKLKKMGNELAGENPSPLEKLLVERILTCWLEVQYYDVLYVQNLGELNIKTGEYCQRRQDRAHKRLLSSIRTLALIRKLEIPAIQVNIGEKQMNIVTQESRLPGVGQTETNAGERR